MSELDKVLAKIEKQFDKIDETIHATNNDLRQTRDDLRETLNQHGYCTECGGMQRDGESFYNGACNSCVVRIAAECDTE